MAPTDPTTIGIGPSTVLNTLKLLNLIMSWLLPDRADLLACCLVSKTFRLIAQPLLCRNVNLAVDKLLDIAQNVPGFAPTYIYSLKAPIENIRLYDKTIQQAFTEGGAAGVWRVKTSWQAFHFYSHGFPGREQPAVHLIKDNRWSSAKVVLDAATLFSPQMPNVELSLGISSSRSLLALLQGAPEVAKCISVLHVECDFVREVDRGPFQSQDELLRMNDFFPDWVEGIRQVVQFIRHSQGDKVLKSLRITTSAESAGPNTPPARLQDVQLMMDSAESIIEELCLQLNPVQFETTAVDNILLRFFPKLRRFSFRLPPRPSHTPDSDAITGFLARHTQLEHIDIGVQGVVPKLGGLRFPGLRSLSLWSIDIDGLDSFLAHHRHLVKLSVQEIRNADEFDRPALDIDALGHVKEWTIDYRVLLKLLAKHPSIRMATPTGISTLADLVVSPEQPIEKRVPLRSLTYLHVYLTDAPWLQVLGQLATAFDYRTFPNLAELRLGLNLGSSPAETAIRTTTRGANECLHAVIVGLATANHLRVLHLSFRGGYRVSMAQHEESILRRCPRALEYVTWQVSTEGYTQTYRVVKKGWREIGWTDAYLRLTSHDHLPACRKTWTPFEPVARLDHHGVQDAGDAKPMMLL
ncbi:hypothetical protein OC845_006061 [Tilletia horrida]|nr:hypothetical protein OC845_006061 [Tilletia horrida]